ncbi:hypothetical protein Q3G72_030758 [Acer saccharum]|nr:hypothetical protein Q3G72_030758 [Acer saccharum]
MGRVTRPSICCEVQIWSTASDDDDYGVKKTSTKGAVETNAAADGGNRQKRDAVHKGIRKIKSLKQDSSDYNFDTRLFRSKAKIV